MHQIKTALKQLKNFVDHENYKGWDVFDGLNSTPFKNSVFYQQDLLRLIWIQFFKRSPINLRRFSQVPKGYNAKGLGLFASGFIYSGKHIKALEILKILEGLSCDGYQGRCWGYNFDWQARAFYVPKGKPNIVTTVFVANAFMDYFDATNDTFALNIAIHACDFVLRHLILFEDDKHLCFAYIPGESARVHNANMLGATLLARVYAESNKTMLLEKSTKAMRYSVAALNEDYAWPYGERSHHRFIDNFHTGFNLVALKEWMDYTQKYQWENKLVRAYQYFLDSFWLDDGCPKYYNNSLYPIDIHCSAQGIVTCLKLSEHDDRSLDLSKKLATWAIGNMQANDGSFYYQKTRFFTNKIPYIRWAQAWMFYALSFLLSQTKTTKGSE